MAQKNFPRVLQILPAFQEGGGVERGTRDIADALLEKGHPAFIASAGGNFVSSFVQKGGVHVTLPLKSKNPLTLFQNIARLKQAVKDHAIDILHARSRAPAWSAFAAARSLNLPFITTYHAPYNGRSFLKKKYNSVMARGQSVIAISEFIAQHMQQQYGMEKWFDPQCIQVIHRGIDTHFFDPTRVSLETLAALREQYDLPYHARILLLPGRLTRWKGQEILLEALAALNQSDVYALFVGESQGKETYAAALRDKASACGVAARVRFIPHTAEIPSFYALATLVISASTDPEGFGRTIAEAGAMQRPLIATAHGAALEIVIEEKTGWLVPAAQVNSLTKALQKALALPEDHLQQMGEAARQHIVTHFSQDSFCQKTLHVYETIGKRNRP